MFLGVAESINLSGAECWLKGDKMTNQLSHNFGPNQIGDFNAFLIVS